MIIFLGKGEDSMSEYKTWMKDGHTNAPEQAGALTDALRLAERCLMELYPSRAGMLVEYEEEYCTVTRVINKIHAALAQRTPATAPAPQAEDEEMTLRDE